MIAKFEVMEGAPVRGECIPVRLFLSRHDLTPTYKSVNNKFSVKYYLNLVVIDDEDRTLSNRGIYWMSYFKFIMKKPASSSSSSGGRYIRVSSVKYFIAEVVFSILYSNSVDVIVLGK